MKLLKLWMILVLLIFAVFISCKKADQDTEFPLPKLKSVSTLGLFSQSDKYEIKYNANGTIAQVDLESSSKPSTYMTYEYKEGKLNTLKHYQQGDATKTILAEISVNYIGDKLESLIIEGRGVYAATSASYEFNYGNSTFIYKETLTNLPSETTVNQLRLDQDGEYDENINPLHGLLIVKPYTYHVSNTNGLRNYIEYRFDVESFLSLHNRLKDGFNRTYTYKYNNFNLPESQSIVSGESAIGNMLNIFSYY